MPGVEQLQTDCENLRAMLSKHPEGLTAPQILRLGWDKERLKHAAAALRQANRIDIQKHATDGVIFVPVAEELAQRFSDLSEEHKLIFKLISDASIQGIWAKDLASKSKIPAGTLSRLTKTMEHRKLIKQITPAQYKSRKVWMLYELEPATELSGGSWYKDGQIDSDLIQRLRSATLEYVSNCAEPVSASDVQVFLASQHLSRSIENVESIIRTLVLDRELLAVSAQTMKGGTLYSLRRKNEISTFSSPFFRQIPCISCPSRDKCAPGHAISPETCQFMNRWLNLTEIEDAV
jgi:DNA-directed RNA polymerase III subunit RPC6